MNNLQIRPGVPIPVRNSALVTEELKTALFEDWLKYLDASQKTIQTYTRSIRQFILWLSEECITRPTRDDIRKYRDHLAETGKKPTTVSSYLMACKQFFNWTEEKGIYPNIAKGVKLIDKIDTTTHKHGYLTTKQIQRILNGLDRTTLKGLRDYALISLMVTTGLRTISVSLAKVEDIGTAGDYAALYYQGKGHSSKDSFVKLADPVEKAIGAYLKARNAKPGEPLFSSTANRNKGQAMTTRAISGTVKDCMKNVGIISDKLTAHSLRHTAGTMNIRAGGTLQETMQLLDHRQIATTTIYAHAVQREKNQSEERISAMIFGKS